MKRGLRTIDLHEWEPCLVARDMLSADAVRTLVRDFSGAIRVERDVLDDSFWCVTPLGYVGSIPIEGDVLLMIHPKTPVRNLFRMIEQAYMLDFRLFQTLQYSKSLQDFFDALATRLAESILLRSKRGLYRVYRRRQEVLDGVRGRINMPRLSRQDWKPELPCRYEEQTSDGEDNQILLWTLHVMLRSRCCSARVLPKLRKAWHGLVHQVSLVPCSSSTCAGRTYNRLNGDYQPMHALCRFFLDNIGPAHESGERAVPGFLINMAALFERFVAEWMRSAPELAEHGMRLAYQDRVVLHDSSRLTFIFDILLKDTGTGETRYVIDTKYKVPEKPANEDVFQVISYAAQQECAEAILIYPEELQRPVSATAGNVRVRSLAFPLDAITREEFDGNGRLLLARIFEKKVRS